jgi:hypothetical protein
MMIRTLYLDLDGVVANFDKRWRELFNETASDSRDRKNFSPNWDTFIANRNFASLDLFPGAEELLAFVRSIDNQVNVEILSSSGGKKYHNEVSEQKHEWLDNLGVKYSRNFVPGRILKRNYATPDSILVDDTEDVIDNFRDAGGIAILHTDAAVTIAKLKEYLGATNTD